MKMHAIRAMVGLPVFVSNSFKIFGIYGERAGGLSVIQKTKMNVTVCRPVKRVRRLYSSPPSNGAKLLRY